MGSSRWRPRCSWKPQLLTLCLEPVSWPTMAAMAISDCGPMPCLTEEYELPWISRIYHQTQLEYHTDFISLFYTLDIYKYIVLVYIYIYIYIRRFPKMGVPSNHPCLTADFPWNKPASSRGPRHQLLRHLQVYSPKAIETQSSPANLQGWGAPFMTRGYDGDMILGSYIHIYVYIIIQQQY